MDINVDTFVLCFVYKQYRIVGNFRGRKLLKISRFCGYTRMFSPQNLGRDILWHGKSEQFAKFFSAKIIFFTNPRKFSPSKVSRYTVLFNVLVIWPFSSHRVTVHWCQLVLYHDRRLPQVLKFQRTELWNLRVGVIDCCLRNNTIVLPAPHHQLLCTLLVCSYVHTELWWPAPNSHQLLQLAKPINILNPLSVCSGGRC